MRRWAKSLLTLALGLGVFLLVLVAAGGANARLFVKYFPILFTVNIILTASLFTAVCFMTYRLWSQYRQNVFGTKIIIRIAKNMVLVSILPCLLIFAVSSQFIGRTIDSWFDVSVEKALNSSVTLYVELTERELSQLQTDTELFCSASQPLTKESLRQFLQKNHLSQVILLSESGYARDSVSVPNLNSRLFSPSLNDMLWVKNERVLARQEGDTLDPNDPLRLTVLTKAKSGDYLCAVRLLSNSLAETAQTLETGYRRYQELAYSQGAMKKIYIASLSLTLCLVFLACFALAFAIARKMTSPLSHLAVGTHLIAEGHLVPIKSFQGNDELNQLTQSFNSMVEQLSEASAKIENQRARAEEARAYLEHILTNLRSGVLIIDHHFNILSANRAARTILRQDPSPQSSLESVSAELYQLIKNHSILEADLQSELVLNFADNETPVTLYVKSTKLTVKDQSQWILVFDDISPIMSAQRTIAWGEVARRLAHEIKNPLTPIRLATERLEMKLSGVLDNQHAAFLTRTCSTIVTQVDAMRHIVDDFRSYAKLPPAVLKPISLSSLLNDLLSLYSIAGTKIQFTIPESLPDVPVDATQIRQVIHNLLSNAIDATSETESAEIHLWVQETSSGSVRITLQDNGPGFPPSVLSKAFEPYVTTKPTGTGLGLPIVKKIIEEHHGKITLDNVLSESGDIKGARIVITLPL